MFNFSDVCIFWINNPANMKRYENMQRIIKQHFPNNYSERIDAVMEMPKFQGVSMAHTVALLKGINSKKPFIIFEDDIVANISLLNIKALEDQINKVDRLDAVYLGLSIWGTKGKTGYSDIFEDKMEMIVEDDKKYYFKYGANADKYNNYFIKLVDMFSAHSILYLSEIYAVKTLKCIILAVSMKKPHDIYLPDLLRKYNVLALKRPWFYQSSKLGGQEKDTNIKINT